MIPLTAPLLLLCLSAATERTPTTADAAPLKDALARHGVDGTLWIESGNGDLRVVHDPERAARRYLPASTFKILNSLIALETGVIADEEEVIPWDGVERSVKSWNRDHNLRSAIRYSAVWFYQEIARRIGEERMQRYLDEVGFGNQSIGGGIDRFWLDGELRISAAEQIAFLKRLHRGDLPFSARSLRIVKDIMTVERTDDHVIRAKTGWARAAEGSGDPDLGWYVGYVEKGDEVYFFATQIDMPTADATPARIDATYDALRALGVLPPAGEGS